VTVANITDTELISKLLQATEDRKITWEKAEVVDQFVAKYAGKWTLTIDKAANPEDQETTYWLALSNVRKEEILSVHSSDEGRLDRLFELARRRALKVDEALSDLLKEIEPGDGQKDNLKDEDIPF
jgi:hypothetical protein